MNLKNILIVDYRRVYMAITIDNKPVPNSTSISYGHQIDEQVDSELAGLSDEAIGYKIEDDGVLVGCYIVDFGDGGLPVLVKLLIRKVYTTSERQLILQQVNTWIQKESQLI